jgi:hypothetical protein
MLVWLTTVFGCGVPFLLSASASAQFLIPRLRPDVVPIDACNGCLSSLVCVVLAIHRVDDIVIATVASFDPASSVHPAMHALAYSSASVGRSAGKLCE